jgi:hypothetical protein
MHLDSAGARTFLSAARYEELDWFVSWTRGHCCLLRTRMSALRLGGSNEMRPLTWL